MKHLLAVFTLNLALNAPAVDAKTLTIAFDKSGSNPLLGDPHFAASAAAYVAGQVKTLKEGDVVRIRSFGARNEGSNLLDQTFVLNRRLRARKLAQSIQNYIANLPNQDGKSQSSTNIIAFLEFDSGLDCGNGGMTLLLTDGLESSEYISPKSFLAGRQHLPKPDAALKGCEIIFYGLGAGLPPKSAKFMREEWTRFIKDAGGQFTAIMK